MPSRQQKRVSEQTRARASQLRRDSTAPERLLWSVLRGRQLGGLKFRRQHVIGPYVVDFACHEKRLVIEVDGRYHDVVASSDLHREAELERLGWRILRFANDDVESNAENVARGIARFLGLDYQFRKRDGRGSGLHRARAHHAEKRPITRLPNGGPAPRDMP